MVEWSVRHARLRLLSEARCKTRYQAPHPTAILFGRDSKEIFAAEPLLLASFIRRIPPLPLRHQVSCKPHDKGFSGLFLWIDSSEILESTRRYTRPCVASAF